MNTSKAAISSVPTVSLLAVLLFLAGCGGSDGTSPDPQPQAPVITIQGVTAGEIALGPVTITVSVNVGSFTATLNGAAFFSGTTVATPGTYAFDVQAQNQGRTSQQTLNFEIQFGGESVLIIRMLNLGDNDSGGGGDAILLTDSTSAGERHFLIDAGPAGVGASDQSFVQRELTALGVDTLEAMLLTHAHSDHYAGMDEVMQGMQVNTFYYNGQLRNLSSYTTVVNLANTFAGQRVAVNQVIDVSLGFSGLTDLQVIPPLATNLTNTAAGSSELNDGSLGTTLTRGTFTMFFTGDGEIAANQRWRTQFAPQTGGVTALKVGHHSANDAIFDNGSSGASAWLTHTDPDLQLITANGRTHPREHALTALLARTNTETYCTSVHGRIEVRVDPAGDYFVQVERNAGMDCVPGTEATT